ncbi:MAG TPA: dihydrolipoyllysine-residue acetyltransferase [Pseudomonadales bacterium]|jgi:pyruvate dehydrogenase E2 component (dihydrolipoamide acetyltransferase)|nr:dihydrolipoyllysine-residue acetyltransferase [Pseudomonadales bacterium]
MSKLKEILVPDVGEATDVEVIEILVAVGDRVGTDESLVVLESEKASMEIPSPTDGEVERIQVQEGDKVEEGDLILELSVQASPNNQAQSSGGVAGGSKESAGHQLETVRVPDVGEAKDVTVIEILVGAGSPVEADDSLIVLESDKASMEIPSPCAGIVTSILLSVDDQVEEGDDILTIETESVPRLTDSVRSKSQSVQSKSQSVQSKSQSVRSKGQVVEKRPAADTSVIAPQGSKVHAGPAVRKQAREYGVDLMAIVGSGTKGRILKEDVKAHVKQQLDRTRSGEDGAGIPKVPQVDFAKFGAIEILPLSRIRRASAKNLHRSWLNVPHVTQFDEADITELEEYRKQQNLELSEKGVKLTPLSFLIKSVVSTLKEYPQFNASLHPDGEQMILKKYIHIGIAVETEEGLVVPVIRDADCKGLEQLAIESAELARQARDKKLPLDAMQGCCFTISSLGGIGGTAFTPIVNAPEVAILGVSRATVKPIFDGENFQPRTMLPLSLSYDHRAIDGAEAARFTSHLSKMLSDVRHMLL